jgi:EAL and modified HD-GYP domain-containing signal transduction protein
MSAAIDVFIGRQPILHRNGELFAYELLFRGGQMGDGTEMVSGDSASAQVMLHALGDIGLRDIAGPHKVFINFTESLLLKAYQPLFPPRQVAIEVLESVIVTDHLIRSISSLRNRGYTIVLDDYVYSPNVARLLPHADIVKIDILALSEDELIQHAHSLKRKGVKLLAEKVETREQFSVCRDLGFDYFQGYFFARPNIIKGQRLPVNKLSLLELLAKIHKEDVELREFSHIVSADVSLSQKLLKFLALNERAPYPIKSVHEGVIRFGLTRLKSWVSMLALAGIDDKPVELFRLALTRAKFCELLGNQIGGYSPDSYFTVGLFSLLDSVLDMNLEDAVEALSLETPMRNALLGQDDTGLSQVLLLTKNYESGDLPTVLQAPLTPRMLSQFYLQSMAFAESVFGGVKRAAPE